MAERAARHASLDVDSLLRIDAWCVRFEKALRGDTPESIEILLDAAPAALRPALFEELLALELATLSSRGTLPPRRDYLRRFPRFAAAVDALYDEFGPAPDEDGASPRVIDGYELQERLSRGGTSVVYRALDTRLGRTVALKLLSGDNLNRARLARFETESRALASLEHPNILRIHAFGRWHDQTYLVLEYASGGTLADRLRQGPLPLPECLRIMAILADAVAFIHAQTLVHRDLKPSNILFSEDGELKIGDFGLVRNLVEDTTLTRADDLVGTPAYMAPEQLNADLGEVGPAADLYALGVIMHHLLTGRLPYGDLPLDDLLSVVAARRELAAADLDAPEIPADCARVCRRCLRKQPTHRYPGAAALAADIERLRQGLGVSAWPLIRSRLALTSRRLAAAVLVFSLGAAATWRLLPAEPAAGVLGSEILGALDPALLRGLEPAPDGARVLTLLNADAPPALRLDAPQGLALMGDRYLAVADTLNHRILVLDLDTGDLSRLAGNGDPSHAGDGRPAVDSTLNLPTGLHFDGQGRLYVADRGNHAIRYVDAGGTMHSLTGVAGCQGDVESFSRPYLCFPADVVVTADGEYFVADTANERIRHGHPETLPDTLLARPHDAHAYSPFPPALERVGDALYYLDPAAGVLLRWQGVEGGRLLAGGFVHPSALAVDREGKLYVGDHSRQPITRIAGAQVESLGQETLFPAAQAPFSVDALTVDSRGRIFFTSRSDDSLRVVIPPSGAAVPMQARRAPDPAARRQAFPARSLERRESFSYIGVTVKALLTGLAARLGLDLLVDPGVSMEDPINMTDYPLRRLDMLAVTCSYVGAVCGIDGNRLVVAPAGVYAGLTDVEPLRLPEAEALFRNTREMPEAWRQDLRRTLDFPDRPGATLEEFLRLIEERTNLRFRFLESAADFKDATFNPIGPYEIGGLLVPMILANGLDFRYDAGAGSLLVGHGADTP